MRCFQTNPAERWLRLSFCPKTHKDDKGKPGRALALEGLLLWKGFWLGYVCGSGELWVCGEDVSVPASSTMSWTRRGSASLSTAACRGKQLTAYVRVLVGGPGM